MSHRPIGLGKIGHGRCYPLLDWVNVRLTGTCGRSPIDMPLTGNASNPVARQVVLELCETKELQEWGHVHGEPSSPSWSQSIPTSNGIVWRSSPSFDCAFGWRALFVFRPKLDPSVAEEHGMEVRNAAQPVREGIHTERANKGLRIAGDVDTHPIAVDPIWRL